MIISPPFLPDRAGACDDAWLDAAMAQPASQLQSTAAPDGASPSGPRPGPHIGLHIQAPLAGGVPLPVRAIADGKVVFAHPPTAPEAPTPAGTSDGFLVIEHRTEIGANGDAATEVVYYSACMHLAGIATCPATQAPWAAGDAVYRKEVLGTAGRIDGHEGRIRLAICCDRANLARLTGRGPDRVDPPEPQAPTADGRTDSVFGRMYVYLPAGTPTCESQPAGQLRGPCPSPSHSLRGAQWIRIACEKGAVTLASFDRWGATIGVPRNDSRYDYIPAAMVPAAVEAVSRLSFGYDQHAAGNDRHGALDAAAQAESSPGGWYELLRFGRNLGADPLPADAAHWRKIVTPEGEVWADLNAPGSFKFSDADFLPAMGWRFSGARAPHRSVGHPGALGVADLPPAFLAADWHLDPRAFVGVMRRCGWLSADEFAQVVPVPLRDHRAALNRTMRKYAIDTPMRQACFLANAVPEEAPAPFDSAGLHWASQQMAQYADAVHALARVEVATVDGHASNVYYRSPAFWYVCAAVNLPDRIATLYSPALDGFEARCRAYGQAVAVLSEERFPDADGASSLDFPEGCLPRTPL